MTLTQSIFPIFGQEVEIPFGQEVEIPFGQEVETIITNTTETQSQQEIISKPVIALDLPPVLEEVIPEILPEQVIEPLPTSEPLPTNEIHGEAVPFIQTGSTETGAYIYEPQDEVGTTNLLTLSDTSQFLSYIGTALLPNTEQNRVFFTRDILFQSPVGYIQAYLPKDLEIKTSDARPFNLEGFGLGENPRQLTKNVEVIDSEGNMIIKEETQDGFHFGVEGQHLIFSKPVQLNMLTALEEGTEVEIQVKHAGDHEFNIQGLSHDATTLCDENGNASIVGNRVAVKEGKISFYSCGASTFAVTYIGGATFANFTDASIAPGFIDKIVTFTAGTSFPVGSLVKDVNVSLDFRPIDSQNPASFGVTNCYPNEKYFTLTSPTGTPVSLINAGQLALPNSSCPRVNFILDDEASTALGNNYGRPAGSNRKPAALLSAFDNQSPFGNWTLRMGDSSNADGVILFGFTVTIETYDPPLCIYSPNQAIIPQFQTKSTAQTREYQFPNFTIQDPKGLNTGYYTTLSISNLNGPNLQTISNTQIQRKANPITLVNGTANPSVVLGSAMGVYHLATATDLFIKRDNGSNLTRAGTYGSQLRLKVNIPAYTRPGAYTGVITYTLYEN